MPRGSSSMIAQSLKTLQLNGPKLVYTIKNSNNDKCMFIIDILSLGKKKKNSAVMKTTPPPEYNNSYWNTMTGTNSSNDRLILHQDVEINSNWYFS